MKIDKELVAKVRSGQYCIKLNGTIHQIKTVLEACCCDVENEYSFISSLPEYVVGEFMFIDRPCLQMVISSEQKGLVIKLTDFFIEEEEESKKEKSKRLKAQDKIKELVKANEELREDWHIEKQQKNQEIEGLRREVERQCRHMDSLSRANHAYVKEFERLEKESPNQTLINEIHALSTEKIKASVTSIESGIVTVLITGKDINVALMHCVGSVLMNVSRVIKVLSV